MSKTTAAVAALLALTIATGCSGKTDQAEQADVPTSTPARSTSTATAAPSTPASTPAATATDQAAQPGTPAVIQRWTPDTTHLPALTWTVEDDPSIVAEKFAQASWQMDTTTDTSPVDAQHRSATFAAPELAEALTSGGPLGGGGAAWAELTGHAGWTTAQAVALSAVDNPDTATVAAREVTVTTTAHGADGWTSTTTYPEQVLYLTLSPAPDGGWLVTETTSAQL
ncbi:hypothetical protein [Kineococcus sp. SYSU DK003]|uniref:hypothetical protein n=1 Tax=Kineococcus sp. SYSU DK003 TaxID=3383124 RepID=UPI003D7D8989